MEEKITKITLELVKLMNGYSNEEWGIIIEYGKNEKDSWLTFEKKKVEKLIKKIRKL